MFRSSLMAFFMLAVASLGLVSYVTRRSGSLSSPAPTPMMQHATQAAPAKMAEATPTAAQTLSAETVLKADSYGHFAADVDIDGHRLRMLVDTGASYVALTNADAASLGLHPSNADFRIPISTANGVSHVAQAHLWRVSIGGVTIYDVDALVSPPGVLQQSLLGMSALRKLRNFEISGGRLVLEQ
jgi:aspartyl protease family protein